MQRFEEFVGCAPILGASHIFEGPLNSPAHAMNKIFEKTQSKTVKTSQNCTKIIKSTSGKANITEGRLGTKNIEPAGQIAHVQRHGRLNRL